MRCGGSGAPGCASARWARSFGCGEFIFVSSCCRGCSRPKSRGAPGGGDAGCCCRWSCSRSAASLGGGAGGGGRNSGSCCLRLCFALAPTPIPEPLRSRIASFLREENLLLVFADTAPEATPGGVCGEHQQLSTAATGSRGVSSSTWVEAPCHSHNRNS